MNCWGATQLILNKTDKPQWLETDDMEAWLATHTRVVPETHRRSGDIVVFRATKAWCRSTYFFLTELMHTGVLLRTDGKSSKDVLWHKPGGFRAEYNWTGVVSESYANASYSFRRLKELRKLRKKQNENQQGRARLDIQRQKSCKELQRCRQQGRRLLRYNSRYFFRERTEKKVYA